MNNQKGFAHLLVLAFLVAVAAGVGWYFIGSGRQTIGSSAWNPKKLMENKVKKHAEAIPTPTLSASDEVNDLQKDLSSTNVDNVDQELSGIESDLENLE